ncbi:MAG: hypothetical protein ACRD1C_13810 [Terriglobales bacterium]
MPGKLIAFALALAASLAALTAQQAPRRPPPPNLAAQIPASAVRKILRGCEREQTVRFIAFRSHCGFEASFSCCVARP